MFLCYTFWVKYPILLGALLLTCSVVHGQQASRKASTQQGNANKPVANAPQPTQTVLINEQQPEKASQNANANSNHAKSYFDMLSPENLPTTILAFVGIVGIIVGVCTLIVLRRQTDFLVNSERAWLTARVEDSPSLRRTVE